MEIISVVVSICFTIVVFLYVYYDIFSCEVHTGTLVCVFPLLFELDEFVME